MLCAARRITSLYPRETVAARKTGTGQCRSAGSEKPLDILVEGLLYPNADSHRRLSLLAAATACPTGWTPSPASATCFLVPPERSTSLFRECW